MEYLEPGLALVVALVFGATGVVRVVRSVRNPDRGPTQDQAPIARRAIAAPRPAPLDIARGIAEILGAVAVGVGIRYPLVGVVGGVALAVLALGSAVAASRPPLRVGALSLAAVSFLLAVFYLGFRD